jgi:hypothetical protein
VLKISKFVLGMLAVIGFITLGLGVLVFSKFFVGHETRTLLRGAVLISFLGNFFSLIQTTRFNLVLGIDDVVFIIFTSVVTEVLSLGFFILPSLILFAKITPPYIEATVFAMLSGIFNLSR